MKKILILTAIIVSILGADWRRVIGPSDSPVPPEKDVVKSDSTGLFIRTAIFGFTEEDTTIDSKNFKRIEIPEEQLQQMYSNDDTTIVGKPQVPYIRLLIAVPDSVTFNITVYKSDYTLYEDTLIYPVPRVEFEDSSGWLSCKEVYAYDTSFYDEDTVYPGKFYEVNNDGHWRDQRVIEVFLYPVQFNPKYKLIYFYNGLDLRIDYSGTYVENPRGLGPFEQIGREILLNYPGIDLEPGSVPTPMVHYYTNLDTNNVADYIIVTHEDFIADSTDSSWIHEFASWRVAHNQFDVGIVQMTDVYDEFLGGSADSAKALRDFLVYAYDNWYSGSMSDSHFAYCLFIGDWDYVPMETCYVNYGLPLLYMNAFEGYFRDVDAADTLNRTDDIMLGRWPVNLFVDADVSELVPIAQKTINYERYPDTTNWRRRGLCIAGPGDGQDGFDRKVSASTICFTDIDYDTFTVRAKNFDPFSEPYLEFFPDSIQKYLNLGEILSAFWGHGGPMGWHYNYTKARAEALTNGDSLPAILSYACNCAMFQFDHPYYDTLPGWWAEDTCFGECFLLNPDGGAVAFYGGTSPIGLGTYNIIPIERILRDQHWILGKALINAYLNSFSNTKHNCFCLLGDPALDLGDYTAIPNKPDLVIRPQGIDISLENYPHHPYFTSGDSIPIQVKVWNIGGDTAFSVDVDLDVVEPDNDTIHSDTKTIDTLLPLDTAVVTTYWKTSNTHPNHYGEIGDCDFWANADPENEITESWEHNNQSSKTEYICLYPSISG